MEWANNTQAEPGLASFRTAIDLIETGAIEVDHCLESMYDLEDAPAAIAAAQAHGNGAAKVGIIFPAVTG